MNTAIAPFLAEQDLLSHVLPHPLFEVPGLGLMVSTHMILALLAAVLVLIVFGYTASRVRTTGPDVDGHLTRGRVAQMFESILEFFREQLVRPSLGPLTDRYIYYVWTVFFFVLFMNVMGLVPIGAFAALITGNPDWGHLSGTATANISLNAALAGLSLFMIVFVGVRHNGISYFKHFCPLEVDFHPLKIGSWGMLVVAVMVTFFEVIGLLIKCTVLAMRLFGNMLAGHLVIAALLALPLMMYHQQNMGAVGSYLVGAVSVVSALALSLLELFVALLQAFIFAFLTVLFIAAGAVHEHHDEAHDYDKDYRGELEHGVEPIAHDPRTPSAVS